MYPTCRPEMLAVGANDSYARVYDRRMLSLKPVSFVILARILFN